MRLVDRAVFCFGKYLQLAERERWVWWGGGRQRWMVSFLQGGTLGRGWFEWGRERRPYGSEGVVEGDA